MRKRIYLLLCVAGTVLPYWQFLPWVASNGLNFRLLFEQLFANRVSAFFATDLLLTAVVMLVFLRGESRRVGMRRSWIAVAALFAVGVSLAFPLFLYLRELHLEGVQAGRTSA